MTRLAWAADNLKPEEVAAYDNVVNSGNKDAIFFAVQSLNQRYKDSVGFEGQQVSGKAPKTTVKGFRSQSYDLNEPYIPGRQNYKGIPNATPEMLRKLQQKKIKNPNGKETLPPLAKKATKKKRTKTA
jgi:hypothetical protein